MFQKMHFLQETEPVIENPFRPARHKHQNHHTGHGNDIQAHSQIQKIPGSSHISMNRGTHEDQHHKTHQHQHRLVSDGHDHQHQSGYRDIQTVLTHIVDLRRLTAGGGRGDAAVKKADEAVANTLMKLRLLSQGDHHIMNDHRLAADKNNNQDQRRDEPARACRL